MPESRRRRRATTAEGRVNTLVDMSVDLAEEQLRTGKISSSTLNQLLKMATTKDRLELMKLEKEVALLNAKTEAIKSAEKIEELMTKAIDAMRTYSGHGGDSDENIF